MSIRNRSPVKRQFNIWTTNLETPGKCADGNVIEKILFGSDGPLVDSRVELYKIRLLKLPPQKEEKVLSGNILRLLPQ